MKAFKPNLLLRSITRLADLTYSDVGLTTDEFRDSLGSSQAISKTTLADWVWQMLDHKFREYGTPNPVLTIDACWWGSALCYLEDHSNALTPFKAINLIDSDPRMHRIHEALFGDLNKEWADHTTVKPYSVTADCTKPDDVLLGLYEETDIYINTSLEHLPNDYKLPQIAPGGKYFLQSNNMLWAEGHINCMPDIAAFVDWVRAQGLMVTQSGTLAMPGDPNNKRFMVAAVR